MCTNILYTYVIMYIYLPKINTNNDLDLVWLETLIPIKGYKFVLGEWGFLSFKKISLYDDIKDFLC